MNLTKKVSELEIGELFSFSKKGPVHMVSNKNNTSYIEYKSYSDGKIRIEYLNRVLSVFIREEHSKYFEAKWFKNEN